MAWYNDTHEENLLNFVIVGNDFSGHRLVFEALSIHPEIACHADLLATDSEVRKESHERYFGTTDKVPDWFQPHLLSAEQYLNNKIFDNNINKENAIGVLLSYSDFSNYDIWDFVTQKCRLGDFCVIHVMRNPVACYVDLMTRAVNSCKTETNRLKKVSLNPKSLTSFVSNHVADSMKINRICDDIGIIPYHELVLDYSGTIESLLNFLDMPFHDPCVSGSPYGEFNSVLERIANDAFLKVKLPLDVLDYYNSSDLF